MRCLSPALLRRWLRGVRHRLGDGVLPSVVNNLVTPRPEYRFDGPRPGMRWCVVAVRWLQAAQDGAAAPVVLAATHERALDVVPLELLQGHAVDVPADPGDLI